MSGWQHTLIDEESVFLRGVNEGYRTWCLRYQKIQMIQKQLDTYNPHEQNERLEMRVQQLKAMTLGQPADPDDPTCKTVTDCEKRILALAELPASKKSKLDAKSSSGEATNSISDQEGQEAMVEADDIAEKEHEKEYLKQYRDQMHDLDVKVDEVFESRYDAECELKDFEQSILKQWEEKKQVAEYWTKRHAALTGMRSAMRTALQRYEKKTSPGVIDDVSASSTVDSGFNEDPAMLELKEPDKALIDRDEDDIDAAWLGLDPPGDTTIHALSDVLAEGVADPKDREEILKREHAGSAEHPHGCRPCHFQGGLCWKGLACSFCHICPKPKRKSKHQRDVDKRRQERYKQVKDDLGIPCLDELTKIDDARRQIMTSSEELKKRVKSAYASRSDEDITEVTNMVNKMKTTVDSYHSAMPFLLIETADSTLQETIDSDDEETAEMLENRFADEDEALADDRVEPQIAQVDPLPQSDQTRTQTRTGAAAPMNFGKVTRRGGMNQRKQKGKMGSGGEGYKGEHYKGSGYEADKGWHMYPPPWEKGMYAWGKKGPPPMDFGWYAKGAPQMAYPSIHPEWERWQPRNYTVESGQSSSEGVVAHSGWGPPPETLQ